MVYKYVGGTSRTGYIFYVSKREQINTGNKNQAISVIEEGIVLKIDKY